MAKFTGAASVFDGDSTTVGSASVWTGPQLGTRSRDANGNEYILLQGTASVAFGDFVAYSPIDFSTSRLTNTAGASGSGPVAVAGTAVVLGQNGWFQIYGKTNTATNIATDSNATYGSALYASSSAGRATTTAAAAKAIYGASAAQAIASNAGTAVLNYPFIVGNATV